MYSVVLMAALSAGSTAPDFHCHNSCHSCSTYSSGCCGYSYGCCGYSYGCCGYSYGCYGSYAYSYYGCGGWAAAPASYGAVATAARVEEPRKAGAANVGRVVVTVPADAKFFIDGQLMKTTSERRTFSTPPLIPGQQYFYDLRAEVTIDGKTEIETQQVVVQGGVTAQASFAKLTAAVQASKALAANK